MVDPIKKRKIEQRMINSQDDTAVLFQQGGQQPQSPE